MTYVPIHCHSVHSLLDGAIRISDLIAFAKQHNLPAINITDHGTMSGIVDAYSLAKKEGIKFIPGIELYCAPESRFDRKKETTPGIDKGNYHLTALGLSRTGYHNLAKMSSYAYTEGMYFKPRVDKELLQAFNEDVILTSGCLGSEINQKIMAGYLSEAEKTIDWFASIYDGRYYIEIQENGLREQAEVNEALIYIAQRKGLPLLATLDCHIHSASDSEAHDVMLCIQTGARLSDEDRFSFDTSQLYLRTPEEMHSVFFEYPEAVQNTIDIANRVDFELELGQAKFPIYQTKIASTSEDELRILAVEGFEKYLHENQECDAVLYNERLEYELSVINKLGFAGYFLVVADVLNWCRENDIPVGPGRGSVVGSLVSFCIGMTELDPIKYGLIFERFINESRVTWPDVDSDISDVDRDRVIDYIKATYGDDKVTQVATFGSMKGKMCIRDIGRVLGLSFNETDDLVKLYPPAKHGKEYALSEAIEMEPRLKEAFDRNDDTRKLLRVAQKLEGFYRHCSKHAAGIVISPTPLIDEIPLMKMKDDIVSQYQYADLEKIGLIKFDFLGLKTLNLIHKTLKLIEQNHDITIDWNKIGYEDKATYELCASGNTLGCFQIDTDGLQSLLRQIKPTSLEDLSFCLAGFRPGPLGSGMVATYIKRRNGEEPVSYPHPLMEKSLKKTLGVIIYQEQIMQLSVDLAGYTLKEADSLRAGIGKKNLSKILAEKERFIAGCQKHGGLSEELATKIFEQIEEFASYCFNASHSFAYSAIAYRTAYLKAHYPIEFMTSLLNVDSGDDEKIFRAITECRRMGIAVLPPDINESEESFSICEKGIRFGLGGLKNVGKAGHQIINKFHKIETLEHLFVLLGRNLNKRIIDSLTECGAIDSLIPNRRSFFLCSEKIIDHYRKKHEILPIEETAEWTMNELLYHERKIVGFYISGHPVSALESQVESIKINRLENSDYEISIVGVVHNVQVKNTKANKKYAVFTIEDDTAAISAYCWPKNFVSYEKYLDSINPLLFRGFIRENDGHKTFVVNSVEELDTTKWKKKRIQLYITRRNNRPEKLQKIAQYVSEHPGDSSLEIILTTAPRCVIFNVPSGFDSFDDSILKLQKVAGKNTIKILNS